VKSIIVKEIISTPDDTWFNFYDEDKNIVDKFATELALENLYKNFFVSPTKEMKLFFKKGDNITYYFHKDGELVEVSINKSVIEEALILQKMRA